MEFSLEMQEITLTMGKPETNMNGRECHVLFHVYPIFFNVYIKTQELSSCLLLLPSSALFIHHGLLEILSIPMWKTEKKEADSLLQSICEND